MTVTEQRSLHPRSRLGIVLVLSTTLSGMRHECIMSFIMRGKLLSVSSDLCAGRVGRRPESGVRVGSELEHLNVHFDS